MVIICPGIHSADLTAEFVAGLRSNLAQPLVFPADHYPAYSALHILEFLEDFHPSSLLFIAFSAGVVGAIGAARLWLRAGEQVKAVIAIDGWGVPLYGDFPIHRLSHDAFTHWSSAWLGAGQDSFYAEPAVSHLDLWRSPQTADGWRISARSSPELINRPQESDRLKTTALQFLLSLLVQYGES